MRSFFNCVILAIGLFAISSAHGQTVVRGPQPDNSPDTKVVESTTKLISDFDVDKDRRLDQQELENVLGVLFQQIRALQLEVRSLKAQIEKEGVQKPKLHITRKVPLGPPEGGVYAGKYPAEGGVYAGKYYPPREK